MEDESDREGGESRKATLENYVLGWGRNEHGELSLSGNQKSVATPSHPKGLNGVIVRQVSSGSEHTALITRNGNLLVCGSKLHSNFIYK
jgi:alpha-tubulin suppressor-like RCC1 family protein